MVAPYTPALNIVVKKNKMHLLDFELYFAFFLPHSSSFSSSASFTLFSTTFVLVLSCDEPMSACPVL
jgi:hypothetical protein